MGYSQGQNCAIFSTISPFKDQKQQEKRAHDGLFLSSTRTAFQSLCSNTCDRATAKVSHWRQSLVRKPSRASKADRCGCILSMHSYTTNIIRAVKIEILARNTFHYYFPALPAQIMPQCRESSLRFNFLLEECFNIRYNSWLRKHISEFLMFQYKQDKEEKNMWLISEKKHFLSNNEVLRKQFLVKKLLHNIDLTCKPLWKKNQTTVKKYVFYFVALMLYFIDYHGCQLLIL